MRNIIRTGVSKANWATTKSEAKFKSADDDIQEISWLDELFDGGLSIPDHCTQKRRPLTFLLKGPPGAGKSTLALEMCYRQALDQKLRSLYISSEAEAWKLKDNAENYGWDKECFFPVSEQGTGEQLDRQGEPRVVLWGAIDTFETIFYDERQNANHFIQKMANTLGKIIEPLFEMFPIFLDKEKQNLLEPILKGFKTILNDAIRNDPSPEDNKRYDNFGMVVIDSLNVIPDEKTRSDLFNSFLTAVLNISKPPDIVLFVIDSNMPDDGHRFWEHVCDVIVEMDYYYEDASKYLIRTIEIVKARYQPHVWGRHQIKIYPKPDESDHQISRTHRKEGGVFIFPSIHWFISNYKRKAPEHQYDPVPTPLPKLNEILGGDKGGGGLPQGRCTAMIGARGAHKSHLGYYHILNNISKNESHDTGKAHERALIISLRDDDGMAMRAMKTLLANSEDIDVVGIVHGEEENKRLAAAEKYLDGLSEENRDGEKDLEILFYPPGYITPEEFYHRAVMSLLRLKSSSIHKKVNVTVLFNSLDQLSARFPLCAKEDVFIPGLIDTFSAEEATSMFIAVDEPGQPEHQYGLLTMADLIMSFQQRKFTSKDYFGHLKSAVNNGDANIEEELAERFGNHISAVTLHVDRFAGGQRAGKGGVLELVQTEDLVELYSKLSTEEKKKKSRLVFTPFSPHYSQEGVGTYIVHKPD